MLIYNIYNSYPPKNGEITGEVVNVTRDKSRINIKMFASACLFMAGLRGLLDGLFRGNNFSFYGSAEIDISIQNTLHKYSKTKTKKEILRIINLLNQAVEETSLFIKAETVTNLDTAEQSFPLKIKSL